MELSSSSCCLTLSPGDEQPWAGVTLVSCTDHVEPGEIILELVPAVLGAVVVLQRCVLV